MLWLCGTFLWASLSFSLGQLLAGRGAVLPVRIGVALAVGSVVTLVTQLLLRNTPQARAVGRQAAQLQRFCGAIKKAAGTLELQTILDASAKVVAEVTGVRGCTIDLMDTTGRMQSRATVGIERDLLADRASYRRELLLGKPLVVRDAATREFPEVDDEAESLVCVPLRLEERIFGAICVYGERGQRLSREIISTLSSLGDVVSLAIAHALVYERLENLTETKTHFLLQASHELRSPADAIRSIAQTLLEGYAGELQEGQRDLIARIGLRARLLSEITSDLLTLAKGRIESDTFVPLCVDLASLTRETAKLFEERSRAAGLCLEVWIGDTAAPVCGADDALRSVLTNLVANAITYTPPGGRVALQVAAADDRIVLEVSDTGIGIPRGERDRLFGEFFRASNARRHASGTGLGLAIVKANVERCGGTVEVDSEEGRGTTFRVTLRRHAGGS